MHLYPREGSAEGPHVHDQLSAVRIAADATDGIDVTSVALPNFQGGLRVAMNSRGRNFLVYSWAAIAARSRRPCVEDKVVRV